MSNRSRNVPIQFYVTPEERQLLEKRMETFGTKNIGAYVRKMALNGYALRLDLSGIREICTHMGRMSSNLNQIAKRLNSTGRCYESDLKEVLRQQETLHEDLREILMKLEKID